MSSLKRFALAMPLAAVAGGATSFLTTFVSVLFLGKESERNFGEAMKVASFVGFWSLIVCLAYTLVFGLAVYLYMRMSGRTPSLTVALIAGILGALPFVYPILKESTPIPPIAFFFPALAILSALVTAWTFWRLALRAVSSRSASL